MNATATILRLMRDLQHRAMSIRTEQATVPASRYDMALRSTRLSTINAVRLARRTYGTGYDARFPH